RDRRPHRAILGGGTALLRRSEADAMKATRRLRPLVVALAAALLVSATACSRARGGAPAPVPPGVPVSMAAAETRDVPVELRAIGTVEAFSTVEVRAQVGGVLERVHFKEGDEVHPGDPLFSLDARPYQAALARARAAVVRDRAQLETANRDLE